MARGVTGGVERGEPRHRYRAVRSQRLVHRNWLWRGHDGPDDAHETARRTRFGAGDARHISGMGHDPSTGPAPQLGHAADMVGMPVRQQDRVHLADSMPGLLDCSHHLVGPAGQSGINQHDAVVDDNRIGVDICIGISMTPSTTSRMPSSFPRALSLSKRAPLLASDVSTRAAGSRPSGHWLFQTADRAPNSLRTSGATSAPKSSIERIVSA
jgi:hypothetical protein